MKLSQLFLTTSLCAVVAMPAFAQSRSFSDVDRDNDSVLSEEELKTAFGANGAFLFLKENDSNGDGYVSVAEIQLSQDDDESDDESDDDSDESDDDSDESDDDSDESDDDSDESDDDSDESDDDSDESDDDSDESDDDSDESDESDDSD